MFGILAVQRDVSLFCAIALVIGYVLARPSQVDKGGELKMK